MSAENNLKFVGMSGLSEQRLSGLWRRFAGKWPAAHEWLNDPPTEVSREEAVSWDSTIHSLIQEEFPDLPAYPERHHIYSDMKQLLGWRRVEEILARGTLRDDQDYWTARNFAAAADPSKNANDLEKLRRLVASSKMKRSI